MPTGDQAERVFLGSTGPTLRAAAGWLIDELGGDGPDLGGVLVVVPGGRAQRRLMELLAEGTAGRALVPPKVVTLGQLADRLMPDDRGPSVAGVLESLLVWAGVLREADPALLSELVPHPPGRDDWPGWWSLADQVVQAADELGARLLRLQDVPALTPHRDDAARWEALSQLASAYDAGLGRWGLIDKHAARIQAIEDGACAYDGRVVLLATADLQPVHESMLGCIASPVTALIASGESDAQGFDRWGGLVESYWAERPIEIDDDAIVLRDRPVDQASAVLQAVSQWSLAEPTSADQITVGLGDASLAGPIARALSLAGQPVRLAQGRPVGGSRPIALLRALGEFANGMRFDKLAQLLRHPDAEALITERSGAPTRPWLTLLDQYATDHLAERPAGGWLGQQAEAMDAVYRAALSLLPDPVDALRPLGEWAEPIGGVLAEVFGTRKLNRHADEDRPVVAALEAVGGVLQQLGALDESAAPHCTFAHAVSLVVSRVSSQPIPEPGGDPALELVGYLELLLDDAPRLVIAGMNEQHVPAPPRHSALLPEGVRRGLGLPGDERRLARDGYALSAMLAWRVGAKLVVGRRSQDGDPLMPSRLLLKTDDTTLAMRVTAFAKQADQAERVAPMLLTPGKVDRFIIPTPMTGYEPPTKLRVTAFRDYLACPYRFYLKHVLNLRVLDDKAAEMPANKFGNLAHDALRVLGGDDLLAVDDAGVIAEWLDSALDQVFQRVYGSGPPVAARVQAEQMRYRLRAFAGRHAAMVADGWRIAHREEKLKIEVDVDGQPFTITGQIDRIDQHVQGGWRLIDYKTSDTAKKPSQTHRRVVDGVLGWADLQLPLYLDLSAKLGVGPSAELAYINLPKKVSETGYAPADWSDDELAGAREVRDFVIRRVRDGVFWPPLQPPPFDDGLAGLCADAAEDRQALIALSAEAGGGGAGDV